MLWLVISLLAGGSLLAFAARLRAIRARAAAAEARLMLAIEGNGIGIFDVDLASGTGYVSPSLARLAGLPASEQMVPLAQWWAALPPEHLAESRAVLAQKLRERVRSYDRELRFTRADGAEVWLLLRVQILWQGERAVRLRGACIDLSERKAVDALLRQTEAELSQQVDDLHRLHELSSRLLETDSLRAQLQMTLRTLADVHGTDRGLVWLFDTQSGRLNVEASVGYDDDALARLLPVRSGEGASGLAFEQHERVIVEDTEHDAHFAPFREMSRREGFRAVHSTPLIGQRGDVLGAMSMHFAQPRVPTQRERALADICSRKAAVFIERARAQAALQDADRRKDEFLAVLAHELRNPLAPIRQAAMLSIAPNASDAQKRWSQEVIDRQVQHMALLLDDLLDVSRITRGVLSLRKSSTELAAVVEAAIETARPLIDAKHHQLVVELPPQTLRFEADPLRISQVVANLLTNAAKYTDAHGHIRLTAQVLGGELLVEVSDDGIGIAAESLHEVFTMFTQLRPQGERSATGLGIGLALAKGLVELHGGSIAVRSAGPGRGSSFSVRLPIGAPAHAAAGVAGAAKPRGASARKVLIADDNRDAAQSLCALLELQGHEVELAFDGDDALLAYRRFVPDVCLLDVGMPGRSGNEVALAIRGLPGGERPVLVAITGWGQERDKSQALAAGFDHHLTKPVDPERLASLVAAQAPRAQALPQ
jgi:PAS domain S-box-containing protein